MINTDQIKNNLKTSLFGKYIYYFPEIDSTNAYAYRLAQEGAPEGTVILTDYQIQGKGRHGREWKSPKNANILMSIILKPQLPIEQVVKITLASAGIVVETLERILKRSKNTDIDFSLKWPNDVMVNGKKIAGILAESSLREKDIIFVIVGIGINVNQDLSSFDKEIREKATSLYIETSQKYDRETIISDLINTYEKTYINLERTNYNQVVKEWKQRCNHIGKQMRIETHSTTESGRFLDVDEKGILLYQTANGKVKELVSGTIKSIKAVNGFND